VARSSRLDPHAESTSRAEDVPGPRVAAPACRAALPCPRPLARPPARPRERPPPHPSTTTCVSQNS